MAQTQQKRAKFWFYSRDIDLMSSSLSGSNKESAGKSLGFNCLRHWAGVLDYMRKGTNTVNKRVLYEANNKDGLLVARDQFFGEEEEEEEWKAKPGFYREDHGEVYLNEAIAKKYCEDFNQRKIIYVATEDNCQMFLEDFASTVLTHSAIQLPIGISEAKPWFFSGSSTLSTSLINIGSTAIIKDFFFKQIIGEGLMAKMSKEFIKDISLNGFGKISILAESPFKEWMVEEGKQLMLTSLGELTENMLNASRGAFTWWNLLQIPVELIMGPLLKKFGATNLEAYGGKKLASFLTAAGVGIAAGGSYGLLGAVIFWIASEIIATMVKLLLRWAFPSLVGQSETVELVKSIYRYFEIKISSGLDASIKWMRKYMDSTQTKKKVA